MGLFSRIRLQSNRLTPAQERIVHFLQKNAYEVLNLPINELARRCHVGEATIVRFYRMLDYQSFSMFRIALSKELADDTSSLIYDEVDTQDELHDIIRKILHSSIQGISDLENQIFSQNIITIATQFCKSSFIHVIGLGFSGIIAQNVMHKLIPLGLKVFAYTDSQLITSAASVAHADEVFFAISHSGENTNILKALALAKKQGCFTCALTSSIDSTITREVSSYLLSCSFKTKTYSDFMISPIIQLVIINILHAVLFSKMKKLTLNSAGLIT